MDDIINVQKEGTLALGIHRKFIVFIWAIILE